MAKTPVAVEPAPLTTEEKPALVIEVLRRNGLSLLKELDD